MRKRKEWPQGAIKGIAQVRALIQRAKTTGEKIPVWHYDGNDGTYLYRFITASSFIDDNGLNYFDRNGCECRTGPSYTNGTRDWYLFTNYWFVLAYALQSGWQPREFIL